MKKIVSLLLATSVAASMGFTVFAEEEAAFSDILGKDYEWARESIEQMVEAGYIKGYDDGTYRPDNEVTKLDTILLFSRIMGALKGENRDAVEYALAEYEDVIKSADIGYGEEEVAYMLYRGALTKADVEKFLSRGNSQKPMQRQEAAAIITKAFAGEEAAKSEVLVDLEYEDAIDIDPEYSQYVYYASELGILKGMEDGNFLPEGSVLRSQIAVMLSRSVSKMDSYIETMLVTNIDTKNNNITILDEEDAEVNVGYTEYTKFYSDGELISEDEFVNSSMATLTYIDGALIYVDMFEKVVDKTTKGVYQGSETADGVTTVSIMNPETEKVETYEVSSGAEIKNESGAVATVKNIALGSYIEFDITRNRIIRLQQISKTSKISGAVVKTVDIEDDMYIIISHKDEEYDGMKFILPDSVAVYKNGDRHDLSKIYAGDKIDITLEYGKPVKIIAESDTATYTGIISEILIAKQPALTIQDGDNTKKFDVLPTTAMTLEKEDATIYDLRLGDKVKITVESGVVLKVVAEKSAQSGETIVGAVEVVNTSKGFIKVNGETIFCSDAQTKFITPSGEDKVMRDLKEGDNVTVRGTLQNGAYTASLIIIE